MFSVRLSQLKEYSFINRNNRYFRHFSECCQEIPLPASGFTDTDQEFQGVILLGTVLILRHDSGAAGSRADALLESLFILQSDQSE